MKNTLVAIIASVGMSMGFANAQQSLIDKVKFEPGTILVGMASDYNTDRTFDKYNFFIDDASKLNDAKMNLEYGYELATRTTDQNHFMIYAIKDRKIVDQWLVNPRIYNVFHNGIAYSFNSDQLEQLAEKHPFNYEVETKTYKNEKEFNRAKKELDKDRSIFLMYNPDFSFEGSFEVEFKKDEVLKTPEDADKYLRNLTGGLTKKNVSITYVLNEKNLLDQSQMTMNISGPEDIFNKIKLDKGVKGNWTPQVYEATIVKRK